MGCGSSRNVQPTTALQKAERESTTAIRPPSGPPPLIESAQLDRQPSPGSTEVSGHSTTEYLSGQPSPGSTEVSGHSTTEYLSGSDDEGSCEDLGASVRVSGNIDLNKTISHCLTRKPARLTIESATLDPAELRKSLGEKNTLKEMQLTACEISLPVLDQLLDIFVSYSIKKVSYSAPSSHSPPVKCSLGHPPHLHLCLFAFEICICSCA